MNPIRPLGGLIALLVMLCCVPETQGQNPPSITAQPQSATVVVGSATNLFVEATGDALLSYRWYLGSTALVDDPAHLTGSTNPTLGLANISTADAGNYSVVVSDAFGNATSWVASVTVVSLPVIYTTSDTTVAVGATVNLSADISSAASLTNQWFFNGAPIVTNQNLILHEYPLASGGIESDLTIVNAQISDSGNYWVVSSNLAGGATSSNIVLVVVPLPEITQQPQSQTVTNGDAVVFNIAATDGRPLTYKWYYNDNNHLLSDDARHFGTSTPSFTISNTVSSDSGFYYAVISNGIGTSYSSNAQLTVLVPPSVTKQPLSRSVPQGLATTFSSTGTGSAPLSFQWRLNDVNVSSATASDLKL
ncbi:MAG: hypothetical protein JWO95_1084, partial [Verrucomicrobiales bacterium]|nr:hypothetical protein [Verrucomicrobiales bacterium]